MRTIFSLFSLCFPHFCPQFVPYSGIGGQNYVPRCIFEIFSIKSVKIINIWCLNNIFYFSVSNIFNFYNTDKQIYTLKNIRNGNYDRWYSIIKTNNILLKYLSLLLYISIYGFKFKEIDLWCTNKILQYCLMTYYFVVEGYIYSSKNIDNFSYNYSIYRYANILLTYKWSHKK